jgi:deazaflavin-dependent oxidoreductase (nitroreductase family)
MSRTLLPPRWFITTMWKGHRLLYRATGGRLGLRAPRKDLAGMLRLHTVGRTSGTERTAILCFIEDGPNLVTLAMNGWSDPAPQWWRNLRAAPDARVQTVRGRRLVHAREAHGAERDRLWDTLRTVRGWADDLDAMSGLRSSETPVVVLEPRAASH